MCLHVEHMFSLVLICLSLPIIFMTPVGDIYSFAWGQKGRFFAVFAPRSVKWIRFQNCLGLHVELLPPIYPENLGCMGFLPRGASWPFCWFLCLCPTDRWRRHYVFGLSVCASVRWPFLVNAICQKLLDRFSPFFMVGAHWAKDELIRFWASPLLGALVAMPRHLTAGPAEASVDGSPSNAI